MTSTLLFSPNGRIGRRDFWIGFAFVMVASMLAGALPIVGPVLGLVLIWPQVVIHIKRLHDFGWSGWLLLLPFAVSLVCTLLMIASGGQALAGAQPAEFVKLIAAPQMRKPLVYLEVAFAVEVAFLCWVGFTKGDAEANKFGAAPAQASRN
ncbi:MAG: DUF805 domain-containing protein [Alphaproteobacteria bacterium]|nr:DUF805 domain-containing protein [Alphaproteobacteria bacterium]